VVDLVVEVCVVQGVIVELWWLGYVLFDVEYLVVYGGCFVGGE